MKFINIFIQIVKFCVYLLLLYILFSYFFLFCQTLLFFIVSAFLESITEYGQSDGLFSNENGSTSSLQDDSEKEKKPKKVLTEFEELEYQRLEKLLEFKESELRLSEEQLALRN